MARRVAYTPHALNVLKEIEAFHRRRHERERGTKTIQSIRQKFKKLAANPELGKYLDAFSKAKGAEVRVYLHHKTYWLIYECKPDAINVLEIYHTAKLPLSYLE